METKNNTEEHRYVLEYRGIPGEWEYLKEGGGMKKEMIVTKVSNGYIIKQGDITEIYNHFKDVMNKITEFFGENKIEKEKNKRHKK